MTPDAPIPAPLSPEHDQDDLTPTLDATNALRAELDQARAEVERLRRDVERYRPLWSDPLSQPARWRDEPNPHPRGYLSTHEVLEDYDGAIRCASNWTTEQRHAALDRTMGHVRPLVYEVEHLRAAVERLREDVAEYDGILSRQGDLLTRTVNVLRGQPPELTSWSHHDVPELAQGFADQLAKVKALAAEHDHCSGCPTPWWLRAALAAEPTPPVEKEKVLAEIDRNARAYGWEVGRGAPRVDVVEVSPDNPFVPPTSPAEAHTEGGAKSLYLGIGIDKARCAACAAYPDLPCAVHRPAPVADPSGEDS